jgi:hypothetical protein
MALCFLLFSKTMSSDKPLETALGEAINAGLDEERILQEITDLINQQKKTAQAKTLNIALEALYRQTHIHNFRQLVKGFIKDTEVRQSPSVPERVSRGFLGRVLHLFKPL